MNTTKCIPTAVFSPFELATATSAFTDNKWVGKECGNWNEHATQSTSQMTREHVQNATIAAAGRGKITNGDGPTYPKTVSTAGRSRADAHAEAAMPTHRDRAIYRGG